MPVEFAKIPSDSRVSVCNIGYESAIDSMSGLSSLARSRSFTVLFKDEDVLQVPKLETSPKPKLNLSILSTSCGSLSVTVHDHLLGINLTIKIFSFSTFESIRRKIQSAQIEHGVRLLPTHIQMLTVNCVEQPDDAIVFEALRSASHASPSSGLLPCIVVEPRVSELFSFFLAGVCDLRAEPSNSPFDSPKTPPEVRGDSEHVCMVGEMDFEEELAECHNRESSVGRRSSSSSSDSEEASRGTTVVTPSWASNNSGKRRLSFAPVPASDVAFAELLASQLEAVSSPTTPLRCAERLRCMPTVVARSFDGSEALSRIMSSPEMQSRDRAPLLGPQSLAPPPSPLVGAPSPPPHIPLGAHLLREASVPKEHYSSQLHFLARGSTAGSFAGWCEGLEDEDQARLLLARLPWAEVADLVMAVQSGLRHGHAPQQGAASSVWRFDYGKLVEGCCGGTYIMSDASGTPCAVFKPADEEPYAPLNPKGFQGSSMGAESAMKPGISVGGGAPRECAAYLLDQLTTGCLRAGIPPTAMVRFTHSTLLAGGGSAEVQLKAGSLQRFVAHECTAEDVGTSMFDVDQVHAIGVFDIRTFNMDRNSDNLLFVRGGIGGRARLVPIDHGYMMPSYRHLEDVNCCWLFWPQARQPYSAVARAAIAALDPAADATLLRDALGLPADCLVTLVAGTVLVREAAAAGLTLHQTGLLMLRGRGREASEAETAVVAAMEAGGGSAAAASWDWRAVQGAMEAEFRAVVRRIAAELEVVEG